VLLKRAEHHVVAAAPLSAHSSSGGLNISEPHQEKTDATGSGDVENIQQGRSTEQSLTTQTAEDEFIDTELQNIYCLYHSTLIMGGQTDESYAAV